MSIVLEVVFFLKKNYLCNRNLRKKTLPRNHALTKKFVNLIKLCVGAQNVTDLYNWQKK